MQSNIGSLTLNCRTKKRFSFNSNSSFANKYIGSTEEENSPMDKKLTSPGYKNLSVVNELVKYQDIAQFFKRNDQKKFIKVQNMKNVDFHL